MAEAAVALKETAVRLSDGVFAVIEPGWAHVFPKDRQVFLGYNEAGRLGYSLGKASPGMRAQGLVVAENDEWRAVPVEDERLWVDDALLLRERRLQINSEIKCRLSDRPLKVTCLDKKNLIVKIEEEKVPTFLSCLTLGPSAIWSGHRTQEQGSMGHDRVVIPEKIYDRKVYGVGVIDGVSGTSVGKWPEVEKSVSEAKEQLEGLLNELSLESDDSKAKLLIQEKVKEINTKLSRTYPNGTYVFGLLVPRPGNKIWQVKVGDTETFVLDPKKRQVREVPNLVEETMADPAKNIVYQMGRKFTLVIKEIEVENGQIIFLTTDGLRKHCAVDKDGAAGQIKNALKSCDWGNLGKLGNGLVDFIKFRLDEIKRIIGEEQKKNSDISLERRLSRSWSQNLGILPIVESQVTGILNPPHSGDKGMFDDIAWVMVKYIKN